MKKRVLKKWNNTFSRAVESSYIMYTVLVSEKEIYNYIPIKGRYASFICKKVRPEWAHSKKPKFNDSKKYCFKSTDDGYIIRRHDKVCAERKHSFDIIPSKQVLIEVDGNTYSFTADSYTICKTSFVKIDYVVAVGNCHLQFGDDDYLYCDTPAVIGVSQGKVYIIKESSFPFDIKYFKKLPINPVDAKIYRKHYWDCETSYYFER